MDQAYFHSGGDRSRAQPFGSTPGWEYTFFAGNPSVPPADETLVRGTVYYWTVDETDALGNTFAGEIWEFGLRGYGYEAFAPSPPNEAILVDNNLLLSWWPGVDADEHDVYIGTNWEDVNNAEYDPYNPPPEFVATQSEPNYQCINLVLNAKYYWRVDGIVVRNPPLYIPLEFYKGDVWCFTIICGEAQADFPADGEVITGEIAGDNIWTKLIFIPGPTAVEHTGYFSDNYDDVVNRIEDANLGPPPFATTLGLEYTYFAGNPAVGPAVETLVRGTKYYWTVDAIDAQGNTFAGDIWEFVVQDYYAIVRSPEDGGATGVDTDVLLSWWPGIEASEHDVYFGTNFDDVNNAYKDPFFPPPEFLATTTEPNILVTGLDIRTTYYWRVDEIGSRMPPPLPPSYYKGNVWSFTTEPRRIYVDIRSVGTNNGASWKNAYNFLQDALAEAGLGNEIWVAQGIYKPDEGAGITPGDGFATFQLKNGVAIKGGYAGFGEPNPNARDIDAYETILSGNICFGEYCYNSCHVITSSGTDESAILDGFTITGGNAECWYEDDAGGGIYNDSGSPTISNCTFAGNTAFVFGGGMYNRDGSPTLINCTFIRNGVVEHGWEGMPNDGGGISSSGGSPKLINCKFVGNMSISSGGGMCNYGGSPTLTNCSFIGNLASYGLGGGMYSSQSTATLDNCIFSGNSAGDHGGGMYNYSGSSTFTNCTFSANSAARSGGIGGGIYNYSSSPIFSNCIFRGNSDSNGVDESAQIYGGSPVVNYSSVQGWSGSLGGTGNTGADPMFVREPNDGGDGWCDDLFTSDVDEGANDDFGDVHLLPGSPCIETGDPNFIAGPNDVDIDGHPRIIDGDCNDTDVVDMGAFEFNYAYMGDFDYNCSVDFVDFSIFGLAWTSQPGDFNWDFACNISIPADNVIDKLDLAAFADNWLAGIQ
ncbi:MAG: choice-of-anchor Q domain-containing protein [Planctomycetota bacterium]|jgi:hypothetical protein